MTRTGILTSVSIIAIAATLSIPGTALADQLLTGQITATGGEKMGGVTVSAKA